jgi:hypothetical protein
MMISFLSSSLARWLGAFVLAVVVLGGAYAKGRIDEKKVFLAYKLKVDAEAKAQQDKLAALVKSQSRITKKAEVNHESSINSIRSTYSALRLHDTASRCGVPQVPDPTTKPAEAAAYYVSVAPELAISCAETTQQLVNLQDWARDIVASTE